MPRSALFSGESRNLLPKTLKDGEHMVIDLINPVTEHLLPEKNLEVKVYDAEGNVYKSGVVRVYDAKYGYLEKP